MRKGKPTGHEAIVHAQEHYFITDPYFRFLANNHFTVNQPNGPVKCVEIIGAVRGDVKFL